MIAHSIRPRILQAANVARAFSTASPCLSNVGSNPIFIPDGVDITVGKKQLDEVTRLRQHQALQRNGKAPVHLTRTVSVKGPKGEMAFDIASFVRLDVADNKLRVVVANETAKEQRSMWGTTRTLLNNSVNGVAEGHLSIVKFVGTGFKALLEEDEKTKRQVLNMRIGYCVPIKVKVPRELKVSVPVPHRIIIEGADKQQVKQLAAKIRKYRPPEPYKGKGIFVDGETIKLKARKIK